MTLVDLIGIWLKSKKVEKLKVEKLKDEKQED